jgi:hypothetical protein
MSNETGITMEGYRLTEVYGGVLDWPSMLMLLACAYVAIASGIDVRISVSATIPLDNSKQECSD